MTELLDPDIDDERVIATPKKLVSPGFLTPEEEQSLIKLMQDGELSARDKIIGAYQPLVTSIARTIHRASMPFELEDLVSYGNLALLEELPRYDQSRGSVANFIHFYLANAIKKTIYELGNMVRVPGSKMQVMTPEGFRSKRTISVLFEYLHDQSSLPGGLSPEKFLKKRAPDFPVSTFLLQLNAIRGYVSGDSVTEDGQVVSVLDAIPHHGLNPEEALFKKEVDDFVFGIVEKIQCIILNSGMKNKERALDIILRKAGVGPYHDAPQTFADIAMVYGITDQRVQQIQKRTLSLLQKELA